MVGEGVPDHEAGPCGRVARGALLRDTEAKLVNASRLTFWVGKRAPRDPERRVARLAA
jgi:hypothetical protein